MGSVAWSLAHQPAIVVQQAAQLVPAVGGEEVVRQVTPGVRIGERVQITPARDQLLVQARRIALALDHLEQIMLEDIVQPDGAGLQVELEQGEVGQAFGQGLGVEIVELPQGRGGCEGDVGVLGEDPQLAVMAALVLVVEELEADLDDTPDRMPTLGLVATIEDRHPLFLIAPLDRD